MTARKLCCYANAWAFGLVFLATPLSAGIMQTGDVSRAVDTWTSKTTGYVGKTSDGSVTVDGGSLLFSEHGYLGYNSGTTGTVTLIGPGSKWANSDRLFVGGSGNGTLNVLNGGEVITGTLFASLSDLHGNGTITATAGAILDTEIVFDVAHGTVQGFAFGSGGTLNVTFNGRYVGGDLGAGHKESGSLTISEGITAYSREGFLGYGPGSVGVATVTGVGSQWVNSQRIFVGDFGNGTLDIKEGGQVRSSYVYLGLESGSTGTVTVTGPGSKLSGTGRLEVGLRSSGTLTVKEGGQVNGNSGYLGYYPGSTGTARVTGPGSRWSISGRLNVGLAGNGTLIVEAGGQVWNRADSSYLGFESGSTGTAAVTGAGSRWDNRALHVGYSGNGRLTVSDGGEVIADTLFASLSDLHGNGTITTAGAVLDADLVFDAAHGSARTLPFGSGGTLNVIVSGSPNAVQGDLGAGHKQSGSLTISEGVNVYSRTGYLGYRPGSVGVATVTGAGSQWTNAYELYIGEYGNGMLAIEKGGRVSSDWGYLSIHAGSRGIVTVSGAGSTWTNSQRLWIFDNGTLTIERGGLVSVGRSLVVNRFDSFINMATGGMLALKGDADDSLTQFLRLIQGTDAIRYWNHSLADWAPLTSAVYGTDYTLEYLTSGDLAGYTLLTVGTAVPEPGTLSLLLIGALAFPRRSNSARQLPPVRQSLTC